LDGDPAFAQSVPAIATGIGLIEPIANTVAFYFHERAWRRMDGGGSAGKNATAKCCGWQKSG
jgi:uncharacterized membrane protein